MQPPSRRPGRPAAGDLTAVERRAKILGAARELFQARGYAAVSMLDIAATVGLTKAAVHYHFATKADLYSAVMRSLLEHIEFSIRAYEAAPGPVAAKLAQITTFVIVQLQPRAELDVMVRDAAEHLDSVQVVHIRRAHEALHHAVAAVMRQGMSQGELRSGDPDVLAHAYLHLLSAFGGPAGTSHGFPGRADVALAVFDLFWSGAAIERGEAS